MFYRDLALWKDVIDDVMNLKLFNTRVFGNFPLMSKLFGCKIGIRGTIQILKIAPLLNVSNKSNGISSYFDTYAPTVRIHPLELAPLVSMDIEVTLLNGDFNGEVYMKQLERFILPKMKITYLS